MKRKDSTIQGPPSKRQRCASGPTQLAFKPVPTKAVKRKASTEMGLLASETPRTANRERTCDPSPGCSSPSATNSGSALLPFACDTSTQHNHRLGENYRVCVKKRKASTTQGPPAKAEVFLQSISHHTKQRECIPPIGDVPGALQAWRRSLLFRVCWVENDGQIFSGHQTHPERRCGVCTSLKWKTSMVPLEVLLMTKVGGGPASGGTSAAVSLLDWYDLEQEVLLVMERPFPCVSLLKYMENSGGPLKEDNITRQLVDAAITMHTKGIFHGDIKAENLLLETGSSDPRVRVINFGCGCLVQEEPHFIFSGTSAYTPPEVLICGRYEAAPTTVWQLGALLYKMLDAEQYFSTSEFLRGRIHFNKDLSQDCQKFLDQCLATNPNQRATLEQIQRHPWLQNQAHVNT
ncbi:serine/threonine-protein kinase pim-2-like [Archocentrus centrarchus]|uniref:serine/threonine-protein kinase pim-2-like n=1 Tax=Archocentrus centrarchus TaxID=63155 RepID=UPI0011EA0D6B|nr:serine/threonine-protein kinase pim-2-like [Archocentrus centrarchus]